MSGTLPPNDYKNLLSQIRVSKEYKLSKFRGLSLKMSLVKWLSRNIRNHKSRVLIPLRASEFLFLTIEHLISCSRFSPSNEPFEMIQLMTVKGQGWYGRIVVDADADADTDADADRMVATQREMNSLIVLCEKISHQDSEANKMGQSTSTSA